LPSATFRISEWPGVVGNVRADIPQVVDLTQPAEMINLESSEQSNFLTRESATPDAINLANSLYKPCKAKYDQVPITLHAYIHFLRNHPYLSVERHWLGIQSCFYW
jgi:hypothetical protein